jgi:ABC-type uncharacterized transport system substrate-binding protein
MSITNRCIVHWDGDRLSSIQLEWDFDKYFSAEIIQGYDLNADGRFDEVELKEIYLFAFSNLEKYHYFAFFREGEERFTPGSVENFSARYQDRVLTYSFYFPLKDYQSRELYIAIYDYSFFCQVRYDEETPVILQYDKDLLKPEFSIGENKDYPVYYDPYAPSSDMTLHKKWRPGLETFIPREIHIEF